MNDLVRVLVVDDSALMRKLIPQILQTDPCIQVVGTAVDGIFGLRKIEELKPQVVTLDLEMPGMGGLDMLKEIMRLHQLPVIVVSSHSTEGASVTLKALSLGAFDFVAKPVDVMEHMADIAQELIAKIKAAGQGPRVMIKPIAGVARAGAKAAADPKEVPTRIVAVGVSTGGPQALQYLLPQLPASFPASVLVVQHMPEGFTNMFARRLDEICAIRVKEAQTGDALLAGRALISPGNRHLKVKRLPLGDMAVLTDEPQINGHRPSVDALFQSVAEQFGARSLALLMTGMGHDGAEGMGAVKRAGGITVAQSEDSCVVFGMPKAAIDRGYAARVVSLEALANTLLAQCAADRKSEKAAAQTASAVPAGSKRS
jgi:two-component system chemotaxis response regulator CheB